MFSFNRTYFLLALLLLLTEICIALYVHDAFVRPYVGDTLVVMLIYCALKAVLRVPVLPAVIGVLLFSFLIEWLQYLNFISLIGLQNHTLANVVLGNSFAWMDVLAYIVGAAAILVFEGLITKFFVRQYT